MSNETITSKPRCCEGPLTNSCNFISRLLGAIYIIPLQTGWGPLMLLRQMDSYQYYNIYAWFLLISTAGIPVMVANKG